VTKAVSNQFGGQGVADQMIRFNGYPFLEQESKEDESAFDEPSACDSWMNEPSLTLQSPT
jgi:chloride channel 3/4/5